MLAELLCRHGYETMLSSNDEKQVVDAITKYYQKHTEPLELNNFTERGEAVCQNLVSKNVLDIEGNIVKLANKDNIKGIVAWYLR